MNYFDILFAKYKFEKDHPPIIKRTTGNPIVLTDAADAPLVECKTEIQGSQDLHGYDKPWVGGAGKNKLHLILTTLQAANTEGTWNADGTYNVNQVTWSIIYDDMGQITSIKASGQASATSSFIIPLSFDADTMIVNGCPANGSESTYYVVTGTTSTRTATDIGTGATINGTTSRFVLRVAIGFNAQNIVFYPMLRTSGDSTFAPYSNICPITAYTEGEIEVVGDELGGVNLMPPGEKKTIELDGVTVTSDGKGRYTLKGTNTSQNVLWFTFSCKQNTAPDGSSHSLGFMNSATGGVTFYFYNGNTEVTNWSLNSVNRTVSYSVLSNKVYDNYRFKVNAGSTVDISLSPMICAGGTGDFPSTFSTYYKYYDHTTTFPSAIYRGSEDVVNGEVTSEYGVIDLGTLTWTKVDNWGGWPVYSGSPQITDGNFPADNIAPDALCDIFEVKSRNGLNTSPDSAIAYTGNGTSRYITIRCPIVSTVSDLLDLIDGHLFVYKLATPTTSSVTPTNLPIKSLSGYNHIESSTGDMDITYLTQDYQNFVDIIENNFENNLRTRKGGIKPLDVFRTLEVNKEPEEEEKKDEKVEDVKK